MLRDAVISIPTVVVCVLQISLDNSHSLFFLLVGVEMFKKSMDFGQAGDNVGILLRGLKREDVRRGQVLAAPGTVKTYKKFKAEVYVLTQAEGGRHTPFFTHYRYVD